MQKLVQAIKTKGPRKRRPSDIIDVPDLAKEVAKEVAQIFKVSPEGIRLQDESPITHYQKLVFVIMSFSSDMEPIFEGIQASR